MTFGTDTTSIRSTSRNKAPTQSLIKIGIIEIQWRHEILVFITHRYMQG